MCGQRGCRRVVFYGSNEMTDWWVAYRKGTVKPRSALVVRCPNHIHRKAVEMSEDGHWTKALKERIARGKQRDEVRMVTQTAAQFHPFIQEAMAIAAKTTPGVLNRRTRDIVVKMDLGRNHGVGKSDDPMPV